MEKLIRKIKDKQLDKENNLSKYATKSIDFLRLNSEPDNDIRTPYTRDIDRIIHCEAYSRYIDKTQVFIENDNDHITHRIIHVTLVAKIAKTIGRALNLNEDLIEAIALGHDIGHTPFGHLGESFLNDISQKENMGLFAHNIQSARALMTLENNFKGLNLCIQTLDGIMCHNGEILDNIYRPKKKTKESFLKEYEQSFQNKTTLKKLRPMTLEGCVVRIADIIGYIGRDIEDAIKLNKLHRHHLPKEITTVLGDNNRDIINTITLDIIANSYDKPYIKMSEAIFTALINLKNHNYKNIYEPAYTKNQLVKYEKIFNKLFHFYEKTILNNDKTNDIYKMFINNATKEYINNTNPKRIVIDYMAGSTDDFIINQYKKYIKK